MIKIDAKLLDAAVKGLGITIPIRSARQLKDGSVEVITRDGRQVWKPPKPKVKKTASAEERKYHENNG